MCLSKFDLVYEYQNVHVKCLKNIVSLNCLY